MTRYQQCIEDANIDMTQQMISHHDNHEMAFQTLCDGIHKVQLEAVLHCVTKGRVGLASHIMQGHVSYSIKVLHGRGRLVKFCHNCVL
jgi:hypothetical protein